MEITVTAIAFCALMILNALLALTVFTNALTLWPVPRTSAEKSLWQCLSGL